MATQTAEAHVVHATQVHTYLTCPRMYYFQYVENLVPVVESPKTAFGRGFHIGAAAYYTPGLQSPIARRECAVSAYHEWAATAEAQAALAGGNESGRARESIELGEALLHEYMRFAEENDDFRSVAVEQPFALPVWKKCRDGALRQLEVRGTPVYYYGTFDGIVRSRYGRLWLQERKTASSFPSEQELRMNLQVSFYLLAAYQLYGDEVCGMIYDVVRKVEPKRARSPVVHRWHIGRSARELVSVADYLCRVSFRMLTDRYYDPAPGHHCSWMCAYWDLCTCLQEGVDYQPLIEGRYVVKQDAEEGGVLVS